MALSAGNRLGPYEILSLVGSGGMGEVYRARDTKLGREVALKILPDTFTHDPERLARFRREAQVLAALNHPRIGAIYGLDEANGTQFLVLELVDGESLDKRMARGAIPVDEALTIANEIAEALEAAHEKGIIHRDLKPANVALTSDGNVKVLDFGLAKATETNSGSIGLANSPTLTSPAMMTGVGVILGTAAYMSPEQAKGRAADKRSDMWAFGCVLYEMLTGKRAFGSDDVTDTLANVLKVEPEWNALPANVPAHIRLVLRRCLEKDRNKRVSDAGIVRFLITETVALPGGVPVAGIPGAGWKRVVPAAVTAIVTAAVATLLAWNVWRAPAPPVVRFPIVLPHAQEFAGRSQVVAVSPDGMRVAYAVGSAESSDEPRQPTQLYLRSLAESDAHPIAGSNLDVMSPLFSPDGQWIAFYSFQDSTLKKIALSGGTAVTICKADPPYGVTWDGEWIVFADQGAKGILRVSPNGGEPEVLVPVKPGEVFAAPQMLNNGRTILFTVASPRAGADRWDRAQIVLQGVGSTERRVILSGGSEGHYAPSGHLVYMVGTRLFAVPVDRRTLEVRGGPVSILEGVRRFRQNIGSPAASFAFSPTGSLVYISGSSLPPTERTLALATPDGKMKPLGLPPQPYSFPRVSPDGSQLAVQTEDGKDSIIRIFDLKRGGPARRLTFGGRSTNPLWTRDGRRITFQSDRDGDHGIFWQLADGTRPAERLWKSEPLVAQDLPEAWSPDGGTLLFAELPPFDTRLFTLSIDSHTRKPFLPDLPARQSAFSADGRWLVYTSNEIGNRNEVFVQPFPPTGAKYQISTEGGLTPLWSPNGAQLYYWANVSQRFVAVSVRTQPTFSIDNKASLPLNGVFVTGVVAERNYDITPDGNQFVVVTWADSASRDSGDPARWSSQQVDVVLNWFEELKARVPAK